jgi:hypothetical protein
MTIPTIFDWLDRLGFLRGSPAVYLVLLTAVIIVISWDWRLSLATLAGQYLVAGLLFVEILDPRLAMVKVLAGLFVCIILAITAGQVNWGRLPTDVTSAEMTQLEPVRRVQLPFGDLQETGLGDANPTGRSGTRGASRGGHLTSLRDGAMTAGGPSPARRSSRLLAAPGRPSGLPSPGSSRG